jgi:hypothetical protein
VTLHEEVERLRNDPAELRRIRDAVREAKALTRQLRSAEARRNVWEKRLRELDTLDADHDGAPYCWTDQPWSKRVEEVKKLLAEGRGRRELAGLWEFGSEEFDIADTEVGFAESRIVAFLRQPDRRRAAVMAEYRGKLGGWRIAWLVSLHVGLGFTKVMRLLPALRRARLITKEPVVTEREVAERRRRRQQELRDAYRAIDENGEPLDVDVIGSFTNFCATSRR